MSDEPLPRLRVLVFGGREYRNKDLVWSTLDTLDSQERISCIITGASRTNHGRITISGADFLASSWAEANKRPCLIFPAWWSHGKQAGPVRNSWMLTHGEPHYAVAFPGGPGTRDMANRARRALLHVEEVQP